METVLITGGAGFIGSHVAHELVEAGYHVRVLDNLIEQVHGGDLAGRLNEGVELVRGDVRDPAAVRGALSGADKVIHLAAEVGVGQSMYAVDRYVSVNDLGTATLFQELISNPVRRIVVASSMSIYGEGLYTTQEGHFVEDAVRLPRIGRGASWDPMNFDGSPLVPVATPEWKRPALSSVYALNKYVQERLTLILAPAYGMQGVALRLFNVFGPGQALSNPYTGVLAIFASRLLNGSPPTIFEDGEQRRDFVSVKDVARAFVLALEHPAAAGQVYNIASGQDRSVAEVARALATAMGRPDLKPEITGKVRAGDIRHCFAATRKAADELGFQATADFNAGLAELAEWVAQQPAVDRFQEARTELERRGLVA